MRKSLMKYQVLRLLAVMLALAVMAAACGSDSNPDAVATAADADSSQGDAASEDAASDDAASEDAASDEAAAPAVALDEATEVEDGGAETASFGELEARWADARAATVAKIKANGYGLDGDILTGPGGWTVDFSECPSDWNNVAGVAASSLA